MQMNAKSNTFSNSVEYAAVEEGKVFSKRK